MSTRRLQRAIGRFTASLEVQVQTDGALLERFIRQKDEAAFTSLVRRHGPSVLGVCRRVLGNEHDAEDAFQATFLVLTRKAASVRPPGRVGNWLYGVAYRTALEARRAAARRRAREAKAVPRTEINRPPQDDLCQVLDQELARLPDRYREVVVLCELQGRARKDVARHLGCKEGTVASRLARARVLLAKRLSRHGIALSGLSIAALLAPNAASASVPASLLVATIKAASLFAGGKAVTASVISAQVLTLTEKVVKAMFLMKLKVMVMFVLLFGALGSGAGWLYHHQATAAQPEARRASTSATAGPTDSKEDRDRQEIVLLKRELQKALDRIALLEAKHVAKQAQREEALYKAKPASFWIRQLQDRSPEYRKEAVAALGGIGEVDRSVVPIVVKALQDKDAQVSAEAIQALSGIGKESIPSLVAALKEDNQPKRGPIISALMLFGEDARAAVPTLIRMLKSPDHTDRLAAARALGIFKLEAKTVVPALIPLLKNTTEMDCYVAATALGQIGPEAKPAVPALIAMLGERKPVPLEPGFLGLSPSSRAAALYGKSGQFGGPRGGKGGFGGGGPGGKGRTGYFIPAIIASTVLGKIGPDAKAAVPALLEVLKNARASESPGDAASELADAVFYAIAEIDPMAVPAPAGGQVPGGRRGGKGGFPN